MSIVSQSVSLSYSPCLALPAPKIAGLLCPPPISGLLPARCGMPLVEIIRPARARAEFLALLGPIRSRDEMNTELLALLRAPQEHRL